MGAAGHKVKLPKNYELDLTETPSDLPLWRMTVTTSSNIAKIEKTLSDLTVLNARRRLSPETLSEALARIECAVYAIRQELRK